MEIFEQQRRALVYGIDIGRIMDYKWNYFHYQYEEVDGDGYVRTSRYEGL